MVELDNERAVLRLAIKTFGEERQLTVAAEELSELIKEICKHKRGYDNQVEMIEEIADCYIMLEQIVMMLGVRQKDLQQMVNLKCLRLARYIADELGKDGAV